MTIGDFPFRKTLSAQPRRRRYKLYNPNDDPEFDPDLGSTNDLGVEGCGLEEQLGDSREDRWELGRLEELGGLDDSRRLEDSQRWEDGQDSQLLEDNQAGYDYGDLENEGASLLTNRFGYNFSHARKTVTLCPD